MGVLEGAVIIVEIADELNRIALFQFRHGLADHFDIVVLAVVGCDPCHVPVLICTVKDHYQIGHLSVDQARYDPGDRILVPVVQRVHMVIGNRLSVDRDPVFAGIRDQIARFIKLIDIIPAQIHVAFSRVIESIEIEVRDHCPLVL